MKTKVKLICLSWLSIMAITPVAFAAKVPKQMARDCQLLLSTAKHFEIAVRNWWLKMDGLKLKVDKTEGVPDSGADLLNQYALNKLELSALGIPPNRSVLAPTYQLAKFKMHVNRGQVRFEEERPEQGAKFDLSLKTLQLGFPNTPSAWKLRERTWERRNGWPAINYLAQEGLALFIREVNGVRIGYGVELDIILPMDLSAPPSDQRTGYLRIDVYIVKDCDDHVVTPLEYVFPESNLCLIPTGVELSKEEDVDNYDEPPEY